jgi:protein tyrosine phosphatase (PTP) superfamily phosphohydrolase (DUF442 family)
MTAQDVHQILNYLPISDSLATAGQPVRRQFAVIKAAGYELVINLAMPDSPNALPNEAELVTAHGMEYIHIPVVWEKPTADDLERFFEVMADNENRKTFVHCALNMRVSVFVYLYRVLHQAVSPDVARKAMMQIWEPDPVWSQFLRDSLARYGVSV